MPLPAPNLDDRTFQDLVNEAKARIAHYCPEWTDHNLSDPGITLIELFAWMTDLLLYRLNRVPDKNYVKFLELIGVRLEPARPATVDVTFSLSAPQPHDVVIQEGTEVSTVRTEMQEAITFATDRDLTIRVPELRHVLACRAGTRFHDYMPALDNPQLRGLGVFSDVPQENDGLYLGFANDLSAHALAITLRCRMEGVGVDPTDPPLVWETWDRHEGDWVRLRQDRDTTGGLNRDGVVILHLPFGAAPVAVDQRMALWVRCRVLRPREGQAGYRESPRVTGVVVESLGGLVPASHASRVTREVLGTSDGTRGQQFHLRSLPVLPRREGETLEVEREDGSYEPWVEVPDFGSSGPEDPHFVLDDVTGTIEFGPRIRTPRAVEFDKGRVPPEGRKIRFSSYRSGGGVVGNVGARTLTVLASSISYVASVTNVEPARGGADAEDLEHAKLRGPQLLRSRERAVTAEDFELLACQASPAVGRARCQVVGNRGDRQPSPGVVRLVVVPALPPANGPVSIDELHLSARVWEDIRTFLDERRVLTCELVLEPAAYTWVTVQARLRSRPQSDRTRVEAEARQALYRYLHPTMGGPDGTGWPFGRELFVSEVYSLLQRVKDVDVVEDARLYQVDPVTHVRVEAPRITPDSDGLLCSDAHELEVHV